MADIERPTVAEPVRADEDGQRDDDGLEPMKLRFVELLASGHSMGDAATALDRSPRTLRRWKAEPAVKAAFKARLAEALACARAILAAGAQKAAVGLVDMASGKAAADSARVSAARAVIENATKLGEIEDLEERLAALEEKLTVDTKGRWRS